MDLAVGSDLSKLIITGTVSGTYALHKSGDSWSTGQLAAGGADWVGVDVSDQGKMWAYAFYPGTSFATTVFIQEGKATAGLLEDIDGDGWSRLDEQRCGRTTQTAAPRQQTATGTACAIPSTASKRAPSHPPRTACPWERARLRGPLQRIHRVLGDNSDGQLGSASAGRTALTRCS